MLTFTKNTSGLKKLKADLDALQGNHPVPFLELLSPDFFAAHTRFKDFYEFFDGAGYPCKTVEDLEKVPDAELDTFITKESSFKDWQEMQEAAVGEWIKKRLSSR